MFATLMGLKSVSCRDVHDLLADRQAVLIDVNAAPRWAAGHVPGALNLDPLGFSESDLPKARQTPLVFYCSNFMCRKAPSAALRAKAMGFANVGVMSAGIQGWMKQRLPVEAAS